MVNSQLLHRATFTVFTLIVSGFGDIDLEIAGRRGQLAEASNWSRPVESVQVNRSLELAVAESSQVEQD